MHINPAKHEARTTGPPPEGSSAALHWRSLLVTSMQQQVKSCVEMPGFLENVPSSWMIEWVNILPREDKLALFQTSKWLARHVVEHARNIIIYLPECGRLTIEEDLMKPRSCTLQLLMHAPRDAIVRMAMERSYLQMYGAMFGRWVTDLSVMPKPRESAAAPNFCCVCWGAFAHITSLSFFDTVTEQDVEQLCKALQSGYLQRLKTMHVHQVDIRSMFRSGDMQRLASALQAKASLTSISTDRICLLHQAQGYTLLQKVCVKRCYLPQTIIRQLCSHPTLEDVHLQSCSMEVCTDWPLCGWKKLILTACDMKVLASLPLACIQKVVFCGVKPPQDEQGIDALQDVLTKYAAKLVCGDGFCLRGVCEHTARLVKHLSNQHELLVWNSVRGPSALKELWKALPACVTSVVFWSSETGNIEGMHWAQFWDSIPTTVMQVVLRGCFQLPIDVLTVLVRTAPAHVQRLEIGSCVKGDVRDAWKAAGLPNVAPAHLTLVI